MSYERFAQEEEHVRESPRSPLIRSKLISELDHSGRWDVVVIGGGIHGASFARLAAFNGLKTLLLERGDYANATSSRSSKMAHGGLRYLEMFDFEQVNEGVKSREELYQTAHHLVEPYDFFIPIAESEAWLKFKLGLGLRLYDWFVPRNSRKHRWVTRDNLEDSGITDTGDSELAGGFIYSDGIMNDTRIVLENITSAVQEGATCLNYFELSSFACRSDYVDIGCFDVLTKEKYSLRAGTIVNCAGPWVASAGRVTTSKALASRLRFSRGSHLLFDFPWKGPARFLPLGEPGRYYFVWPHPAGTLVGTTEREVTEPEQDPIPSAGEINEILDRLKSDLPASGFSREKLHYAYAGVRTLPLRRRSGKGVARLSRKHVWTVNDQVLSLLGGKYTTAAWTAEEGLRMLFKLSGRKKKPISMANRKLPGAGLYDESVSDFRKVAVAQGVSEAAMKGAIGRLGSQVRHLLTAHTQLEEIGAGLFRQEIEYALDYEQAESLEDIMRRRVLCEYQSGHGKEALSSVLSILQQRRPHLDIEREAVQYETRLSKLQSLLRSA